MKGRRCSQEGIPINRFTLYLYLFTGLAAFGQSVYLRPAPQAQLPTHIDGNSPAFWSDGTLNLFSSTGDPEMISEAPGQFGPWSSSQVDVSQQQHFPLWIEAAWRDSDGTVFGWYHHEPGGVCGSKGLTAPKIGAVVSYDNGRTIQDLGIVLESGESPDCNSKNGFFAGGHGDFSVVPDREGKYFYFFFTNYGGPADEQGIAVARLSFEDRLNPAGAVWKYYQGEWTEPGVGGHMTPIFTAARTWQREDTDSFWGASVHWNTYLESYVMLLNHACCKPGWPQEGIYVTANADLSNPGAWGPPARLLTGSQIPTKPGYYPQVMGTGEAETDTLASAVSRLYIMGVSSWELVFDRTAPDATPPDPVDPNPGSVEPARESDQ